MIQTALNSMITLMLAKFILNDVPHYLFEETTMRSLKVMRVDDRPATPGQLRYIAILCTELKMTTPYEERIKTFGEAGMMIRELEEERRYRRKLKSGSPGSFRIGRTTVDKIGDDLERTWHRIESDMDTRMQSSLNILKEVLGHYWFEPVVAAWDNGNLVGVAVYETHYDRDLGIRETHLKELASFSHKPGVGRALAEEVMKIGREEDSGIVSVSYGPGNREFYEKLGFVQNVYYPDEPTSMMYKLKSGNPNAATGTCYQDAWRYVMHNTDAVLVHGTIVGLRGRMSHAWVELPDGTIWEPASQAIFPIEKYYEMVDPVVEDRYTGEEAALMLSVGKHGPWTDEERAQWIRQEVQ